MNRPTHVIVHCSDSPWGDASVIEEWHRARGFSGIGYHFVVLNGKRRTSRVYIEDDDGRIELGRPETEPGAHCLGFNSKSLGVCLIGRGAYTDRQMAVLRKLVASLMQRHNVPAYQVLGHGEADPKSKKPCPMLDMAAFRASLTKQD
ncbi:MAG: N-acetylmuramoyl-L-alanine amidase [Myxococcales bacterium]